jgi:thiamine-monophosphate kinase
LGEFGRIDRFFRPLAAGFPGARDLGDDAAVFAVPDGHELVVTTDALVEGVHFLPDDPPDLVARKALRVNLSDLAAMAAEPLAYTLVTALPPRVPDSWLAAFASGLGADQEEFGIHLMGGDSVSTPGPAMLSITAFGTVARGRALGRGGARPGDAVFVTGTLGDSALGLEVLTRGIRGLGSEAAAFLAERYRLPRPRVRLGARLAGLASAGLDVSDGLVADLGHLCARSGVSAVVDAARLPLSDAARDALALDPALADRPLRGGDDYELVLAVPPAARDGLAEACAAAGVQATEIGRIEAGPAGRVVALDGEGAPIALGAGGWRHF